MQHMLHSSSPSTNSTGASGWLKAPQALLPHAIGGLRLGLDQLRPFQLMWFNEHLPSQGRHCQFTGEAGARGGSVLAPSRGTVTTGGGEHEHGAPDAIRTPRPP